MKSIVLIGDKDNANLFIQSLHEYVTQKNNAYVGAIEGQSINIRYEPKAEYAAKKTTGAVIFVSRNDNSIQADVENIRPKISRDHSFDYFPNAGKTPLAFMQQNIVHNKNVKVDGPSFAQTVIGLFGKSKQEPAKAKKPQLLRRIEV